MATVTLLRLLGACLLSGLRLVHGQSECHCSTCPGNPDVRTVKACQDGCHTGYYGRFCQNQNVALGRWAWQSSTHTEVLRRVFRKKKVVGTANKAVDGNSNGFFSRGSCTHTRLGETSAYWTVDLGRVYQVYNLVLYQRTDFRERLVGFEIHVDDHLCFRWGSDYVPDVRTELKCTQPIRGHNVTISLPMTRRHKERILTLCEVLVLVCTDFWFGENCEKRCRCRNPGEVCDKVTGQCKSACASGYTGQNCQQYCPPGTWGEDCARTCDRCRGGYPCVAQTGGCGLFGCQDGWEGKACDRRRRNMSEEDGQTPGQAQRTVTAVAVSTVAMTTNNTEGGGMSSVHITGILLGILIGGIATASVIWCYRRWKRRKSSAPLCEQHYAGLSRASRVEHCYQDLGGGSPGDGTQGKGGKDVEDSHYDYVSWPGKTGDDGYLVPEPAKKVTDTQDRSNDTV